MFLPRENIRVAKHAMHFRGILLLVPVPGVLNVLLLFLSEFLIILQLHVLATLLDAAN